MMVDLLIALIFIAKFSLILLVGCTIFSFTIWLIYKKLGGKKSFRKYIKYLYDI